MSIPISAAVAGTLSSQDIDTESICKANITFFWNAGKEKLYLGKGGSKQLSTLGMQNLNILHYIAFNTSAITGHDMWSPQISVHSSSIRAQFGVGNVLFTFF